MGVKIKKAGGDESSPKAAKKKTAKKTAETKKSRAGVPGHTAIEKLEAGDENPLPLSTPVVTDAVDFKGEGDSFFHVIKGVHSAIVKADSKGEAKQAFMELFGIVDTSEKIQVGEVDEDQLEKFNLNKDGVILDL